MRATSAMKPLKNFLLINKLSLKRGLQSWSWRVECAPVDRVKVWACRCFGRMDRKRFERGGWQRFWTL